MTSEFQLGPPDELAHGDFELVVRRLADDLAFGTDASLFVGSGLEYAQSRPYAPGDSIKMMDWRLSARTGKLYVKEYETLKRTCVYLVVDTSASMHIASRALTKHDMAIWIASAIGLVGLRRLSPVAVVGGGEREVRLNPSLLKSDLWRAIEPLRMGSASERTKLASSLDMLESRTDRAGIVFVLSDLHDEKCLPSLRRIAERHDCAVLHLLDPAEAGRLRAGFFIGQEAETGRTFLSSGKRQWAAAERIKTELERSGIGHLRVRTDVSFAAPLRHFLSSRALASRGGGGWGGQGGQGERGGAV